tara:strand:- start:33 stop:1475 length:1443 start_codon:yes stop_codon:yes gene_type:complete
MFSKPLFLSPTSGTTAFTIDQSIRFNDDDSAYMYRTPSSASNRDKWTWSGWIKRGNISANLQMFSAPLGSSAGYMSIQYDSSDSFMLYQWTGSGYDFDVRTTQVFRDPSAWYHYVVVYDSGNAISTERVKLYVNGQRITNLTGASSVVYPSQNTDSYINNTVQHSIGYYTRPPSAGGQYFDGYMTEINFIDGLALDPSYFGETKSNGLWIPKAYDGSYGTNGFRIDGRDASDLGDDESGNGNDFTTSGLAAHDQVSDSPTNNFATYNVLDNYIGGHTFSEGNLKRVKNASKRIATLVTQGASSGKWYCECYSVSVSALMLGIQAYRPDSEPEWPGNGVTDQGYGYYSSNGQKYINGSGASYGNSWTNGDIIGIAMDLDNNKLYFSKNGTFQDSGDPTSGSTGTGGISITDPADTELGLYFFAFGDGSGSAAQTNVINCGQDGTFAGNTTAGGNSDGNGIGNFKYSVPSGYLALCTKNLGS